MTPVDEPPCWGMDGVPLLPVEWMRHLPEGRLPLDPKGETFVPWCSQLCVSGWFDKVMWTEAPADVALKVAAEMFERPNLDFADRPVLNGWILHPAELRRLPLLHTTVEALDAAGVDDTELAVLLTQSTFLAIRDRLDSLSAALDLSATARSWTMPGTDGRLTIIEPTAPKDVAEGFLFAQIRHVRQAGATGRNLDVNRHWPQMLGARAGCSPEGEHTLDSAAKIGGITRERVRQVAARLALDHRLFRRWPGGQLIDVVGRHLLSIDEVGLADLEEALQQFGVDECELDPEAWIRLCAHFGHVTDLEAVGAVVRRRRAPLEIGSLTAASIRKVGFDLSEKSGFVRRSDLLDALVQIEPGVPIETLEEAIDQSVDMPFLPLGYVFCSRHSGPTVVETARRMLDRVEQLPIDTIRRGLDRRFRFRGFPPPPPAKVLLEFFRGRPEFIVDGDVVMATRRRHPDPTTVVSWIVQAVRDSDFGVMHRTVLFDLARRAGKNHSSVLIYSEYSEALEPVGKGCFTVVGDSVDPALIELAREQASAIRVPYRLLSTETTPESIRLVFQPGNALVDSGVLSINRALARRLGLRTFTVFADGATRGELKVANSGSVLVSLASAFTALRVEPVDVLVLDLDLANLVAMLEPYVPDDLPD